MKKIYAALFAAQAEIEPIEKGHYNPAFKRNYSGLPDVLNTVLPVFQKHGILLIQTPIRSDDKTVLVLETIFAHAESGETITGTVSMPLQDASPQKYGSAMTYARRYALMSMAGLMSEDDDANTAQGLSAGGPPPPPPPTLSAPRTSAPSTTGSIPPTQAPSTPRPPAGNGIRPPQGLGSR